MNIKEQNGVLKNKIIDFIKKNQQATPSQISFELQISQSMTHRHLLKLLAENKIAKTGTAPKVIYTAVKSENLDNRVTNISRKVESTMQKYNVKQAEIFGSMSRGDFTDKSDIDILVDFRIGIDGWSLAGMIYELEDILGKKVDLVTRASFSPFIFPYIKKDLKVIYEQK